MIVVLDTVRADRLGAYGAKRPTSNQLMAVADAGVQFMDVTTSGTWTWPSHAALFTGEPPWINGAHWSKSAGQPESETGQWKMAPLRGSLPTLAEQFAGAGYRTVSLSANSLLDPQLGLTRGFERAVWLETDESVLSESEAVLADDTDQPLFLFINLMAAHAPYTMVNEVPWSQQHEGRIREAKSSDWLHVYSADREPPSLALNFRPAPNRLTGEEAYAKGELALTSADRALITDLYDGELVRLDKALVQLIGAWNRNGHGDGIVAITSDHGEYLGERGLIGHGVRAFKEVTQIPMVLAAPGRLETGLKIKTPVQLRDLYGTLLDLSGIEAGHPGSLVPVLKGGERDGPILARAWPVPVFEKNVGGEYRFGHRLYREGDQALVLRDDGQAALYDLDTDPDMLKPQVEGLESWVKRALQAIPDDDSNEQVQIPDSTLQQLRALGYVQ
jgi:arylsulfatase A-like enzyme